ncbi:GNAT family N-acetyltransferase [Salipaludibacillus sp. HK11]|uniref:GNAT family N-acetyltransferase n=1 Tax=Salipaludibacillus sp. HK11 TaxID=3394320 RepID=UPI0039FD772A
MTLVKVAKTKEELKHVYDVRRKVFVVEQGVPEEVEVDEKEQQSIHFIAYKEECPVGAGRLRIHGSVAKAERVCVLSDERGKGVGADIMRKMEVYSKENNLQSLKLNAQIHAEPFYKSLNYSTISDSFYEANIPHVTMEKNL